MRSLSWATVPRSGTDALDFIARPVEDRSRTIRHGTAAPVTNLPPDQGPDSSRLGLVAVVATFGGLLFGYDTGVINGSPEPMETDLGLTSFTEGVVVPILIFGAALDAIIGGKQHSTEPVLGC